MPAHENYKELIWMLAKTDFKLRYQGSVLGYFWALFKPLLMFAVLNFVFSSLFAARGMGSEYYSLQLLVSIVLFTFFAEGTAAGLNSFLAKSQLVTKIYIPRWTIIIASTLNAAMIFLLNLIVVVFFFVIKGFLPSFGAIVAFIFSALAVYIIILSFSLLFAPLNVKFRDLAIIWEVLLMILFYATPVFYPLQMLPTYIQQILLINPMAFIVHFTKESLINNHFAESWQYAVFVVSLAVFFLVGLFSYNKLKGKIAEEI